MLTFDLPLVRTLNAKLHIDLSKNRISSARIDFNALSNFERPVWLNLSANYLSSLPEAPFKTFLFSDFRNVLAIKDNPIVCDEHTKWIHDHVQYLNYSRGGSDEDVNVRFRTEVVDEVTYFYERTKADYSFYKIREMTCQDNANIFAWSG
jgi:hypothetical protein